MLVSNRASTPLESNAKLLKLTDSLPQNEKKLPYRGLVISLTDLAVTTKPSISFAVSYLDQFNNCFGKQHWLAAKTVFRYLKETINFYL